MGLSSVLRTVFEVSGLQRMNGIKKLEKSGLSNFQYSHRIWFFITTVRIQLTPNEIASLLFRRNRESGRKMKHITDIY